MRQNHAREIMKTFDVTSINGIVISSGDGLLFEVCSGVCVFCICFYVIAGKSVLGRVRNLYMLVLRLCCVMVASRHVST